MTKNKDRVSICMERTVEARLEEVMGNLETHSLEPSWIYRRWI